MTTTAVPQTMSDDLAAFLGELQAEDLSVHTVRNYQVDLASFARWFTESTSEPFTAKAVTPTDVRDYKAHLVTVERRAPATVTRQLAALRKFFLWAKGRRLITELPTDPVKGVTAAPRYRLSRETGSGLPGLTLFLVHALFYSRVKSARASGLADGLSVLRGEQLVGERFHRQLPPASGIGPEPGGGTLD